MALSGFEGFEKRLELHFSGVDPLGLRRLSLGALEQVLDAVQCSIVSAVGNRYFDAYVLSESSLFIYPNTIIIKTCGTTQLLKSIPSLLPHALDLGLRIRWCKYTRGSFIFPKAQPFPHTSFRDEVMYLEGSLPSGLCCRKACVLPSKASHSWHVYWASATNYDTTVMVDGLGSPKAFTIEVCMTQLDRALANHFSLLPGDGSTSHVAARVMTESTGIANINPQALICEYAFEPCGYSMNGLDMDRYSTIHVTPEDGYSYASFECILGHDEEIADVLRNVAHVFRAATMSVSVSVVAGGLDEEYIWSVVADGLKSLGLNCRSRMIEELPGGGTLTYQIFTARRK